MMGASIEAEPCVKGSVASRVVVDAAGMVHGLSQLATLPDPPTDAIQTILSHTQVQFEQTEDPTPRKRSAEINESFKQGGKNTRLKCHLCPRTYSNKWGLKRHVNTAHTVKRKRLVETDVFECIECDYMCASKAALLTHARNHGTSAGATKPARYKCAFCSKEVSGIYHHYVTKHKIEFPEQIMFDNGNVLVYSSINPDGGKAPWFLKEKLKMDQCTDDTCRLCEACLGNPERLADHYMMMHMVDPGLLDHLKRVFRAEKRAHLADLPASHTPKRKQPVITTIVEKKKSRIGENGQSSTDESTKRFEESGRKPEQSGVFNCNGNERIVENTTELLLNKRNDKHAKIEEKPKYKCCFCSKELVDIYKHYCGVHNIEFPEQILFENGNVLVFTNIDTKYGQAPWFISQKEKAENKYTSSTCRLCDADLYDIKILDRHYLKGHKIEQDVLNRLNNLKCLFRAETKAHLDDMPTSRPARRVSSHQSRSAKSGKSGSNESVLRVVEQEIAGLIIYQCVECEVAATTCDASIEHAQLHHLTGYKAIQMTCGVCKFSFEAQCFDDHSSNHLNSNEYRVVKFDPSKLLDNWSELFQGLSENHAERIKSSSTYQHTRRVKMNSNMASGIPLYQCGKCENYVKPKDVEAHCYNYNCAENQNPGHFCSDCDIYFYTSAALTEHEKDHKLYGSDFFRKVTFNCKEDEPINKALQNLKNNSKSGKEASRVKILHQTIVCKFCDECKKSILYSDFDAHAALHRNNQNAEIHNVISDTQHQSIERVQEEATKELNSGDSTDKGKQNGGELIPQTKAGDAVTNEEGTVEIWNSDNDSCNSQPPVASFDVHVEVHVQKEEMENDVHDNQGAENQKSNDADVCIFDEFSEEMTNDLKKDIQHLGLELLGMTYIPDENLDNKEFLEPNNELTEVRKTNDDPQNKDNNTTKVMTASISQIPTNENKMKTNVNCNSTNVIEIIDDSDEEIVQEVENNKPSSRDILTKMLSI